jgi:phosphonate transport system ATP-binding protein
MLEIQGLTKKFGNVVAVDGMTATLPAGQMVGVIGKSGAGKSTLLRMVNRMIDPSGGRLIFEGQDITSLKGQALREWRARNAMIFQQFNLVLRLDVLTNVMLGRLNGMGTMKSMFKLFSDEDRRDALLALETLGIVEVALQQAATLSGGQQQRVAIARAMMQDPAIILADEPIASLDPMNAKLVMEALRRINQEEGITVMANLHTLDTARTYCDRIIGMRDGVMVFDGPARDLTPDVTRDIYGAGEEFDEATTSTALHPKPAVPLGGRMPAGQVAALEAASPA